MIPPTQKVLLPRETSLLDVANGESKVKWKTEMMPPLKKEK